jgi:hypothetical protein
MPIAMNGYSLASNWATRKLTVVVGGNGSVDLSLVTPSKL